MALCAMAQDPGAIAAGFAPRQAPQGAPAGTQAEAQAQGAETLAKGSAAPRPDQSEEERRRAGDNDRLAAEIRQARAKEKGPRRFAADLFETRQFGVGVTDGGIAEDYVLGVGDRLQLNVFGSANFETPLQVDGRGAVAIPKVGTVPVAGLSLGRARAAVQAKVGQLFSRSSVDLSVTKLREVRVFVLGEVYVPGGFLVPNLSSIVNVLGLSGGPTAIGSFRQIRVLRGGKVVHGVDLYPMRAEGLGNLNFGFQNGDTVFVPLIQNQVQLEGGFTRVVASVQDKKDSREGEEGERGSSEQQRLRGQIQALEARLAANKIGAVPAAPAKAAEGAAPGEHGAASDAASSEGDRRQMEGRLARLNDNLLRLKAGKRVDQRLDTPERDGSLAQEFAGQPYWLSRWLVDGVAPTMQFELLPGETVSDALRFGGGLALQAFSGSLSLKRLSAGGALTALDIPAAAMERTPMQKGDVLTALPQRDAHERSVRVEGWTRVQGVFAREEGLRAGDLLKKFSLALPDTYLERGELVRTLADGTRTFQVFNLTKAMAGDAASNLLMEDRDTIVLYRVGDLRLPKTLEVLGPVTRPGVFEFLGGMRVSDLLFRAGVPLKEANRYVAELAHSRDGKVSEVRRLNLGPLLSTEGASPVDLKDEAVNPKLEPFDRLTLYANPDFRPHRNVILSGQVVRPGSYTLEAKGTTLKQLVERAGGLTDEAMPANAIYLRATGGLDPERNRASVLAGLEVVDPTSNGINEILARLNETKRSPTSGNLMINPLMHTLKANNINRLVVNVPALLAGDAAVNLEVQDGDEIIFPRKTEVAYVVGEMASPFVSFKVTPGMKVKHMLELAGGPTRNADTWNIRLLKADGRIVDHWVSGQPVGPGDAILVPQRIRRDVAWQENLSALTPIAILLQAFKK